MTGELVSSVLLFSAVLNVYVCMRMWLPPPFPLSTTMLLTCRFLPYFHNRNDLTVFGGHFVPLLQMEEDIDN